MSVRQQEEKALKDGMIYFIITINIMRKQALLSHCIIFPGLSIVHPSGNIYSMYLVPLHGCLARLFAQALARLLGIT